MDHLLPKVINFEIVAPYTLKIFFSGGEVRTVNFEPVLHGYYYGPLRNISLFNQVRIDHEIETLVWPNDADIDPATLYNWHNGDGDDLQKRLKP